MCRLTVRSWVIRHGIHEDNAARRKFLFGGHRNPAYRGGRSRNGQRSRLEGLRGRVCEWCGMLESEEERHRMHMHHIDHDTSNGDPSNLAWLCYHCNLAEAHLWNLREKGRARWALKEGRLVAVFPRAQRANQEIKS